MMGKVLDYLKREDIAEEKKTENGWENVTDTRYD